VTTTLAIGLIAAPGTLARYAPVYVLDRAERNPPVSVRAAEAFAPGPGRRVADESSRARVYGRAVGPYLQYWTFYADNPQDRGILRTGRHQGDWELVQLRVDGRGRPVVATYTRHSWAERCGWGRVEKRGGAPVVYVANGSHAAYFTAGVHARPFPDPHDEARGDGAVVRPPVEVIADGRPPWMGYRGRWGASEKGIVPGEHSSPTGPAFQGEKWSDPAALEASARPCGSGSPGRPWLWPLAAAAATLALLAGYGVVRASRWARR
jgi:hypothetical protein